MKSLVKLSILLAASAIPAAALADKPVEIRFAGEFAGKPFACATAYEGVGVTKSTVNVADFRVYVSGLALTKADGSEVAIKLDQDGKWQVEDVALLDFEDASGGCVNGTPDTNMSVKGMVPDGDYVGLKVAVGVPFAMNHRDPTLAPSPLNLTAMFWNWQGGYKFMKVDLATAGLPIEKAAAEADHTGQPAAGAKPPAKGWALHLGSTMCAADSKTTAPSACKNPNLIPAAFAAFDPAKNVVVIDPAKALVEANVDVNAPETSPGCMSFPKDPDCVTVMPKLGLGYDGAPAGDQAILSSR